MENIVVFGRGNFYKANKKKIEERYNISALVDNTAKTDILIHMYNSKELDLSKAGKILIMVYSFMQIVNQLLNMGVEKENILIGLNYFGISNRDTERQKIGKFELIEKDIVFTSDLIGNQKIEDITDIEKLDNLIIRRKKPIPFDISRIGMEPIDSALGFGRGHSISRYYIDRFIEKNQEYIAGNVMEVGDDFYTEKYGNNKVKKKYILHVNGGENRIKGDLQTGEGIEEGTINCFILTQVLDFIYDLRSSCRNIVKALKRNGVALITVAGISQISRFDMDRWGHYWCFTDLSLRKLFAGIVGDENVQIETFGNVKSSMMRLYGACMEDMMEKELNKYDKDYQVIIGAVVKKS